MGNTTDYYTKDITVAGEVIDDGGSGVAGLLPSPPALDRFRS